MTRPTLESERPPLWIVARAATKARGLLLSPQRRRAEGTPKHGRTAAFREVCAAGGRCLALNRAGGHRCSAIGGLASASADLPLAWNRVS